jgi:uncharacterized protein YlaI
MSLIKPPRGSNTAFYRFLSGLKALGIATRKKLCEETGLPYGTIVVYSVWAKKFGFLKLHEGRRGLYEISEEGVKFLEEESRRRHVCPECGREFIPSPRAAVHEYCSKRCYNKAWRKKNRTRFLEWRKKYWEEHYEELHEKRKQYRQRNKEKIRFWSKNDYLKHHEKRLEYRKKYYRESRIIYHFLYGGNNYQKRRGFLQSEGMCIICGETNPLALEDEHVFGKNHPLRVTLCGSCHRIRHRIRYPKYKGWEILLNLSEIFK